MSPRANFLTINRAVFIAYLTTFIIRRRRYGTVKLSILCRRLVLKTELFLRRERDREKCVVQHLGTRKTRNTTCKTTIKPYAYLLLFQSRGHGQRSTEYIDGISLAQN